MLLPIYMFHTELLPMLWPQTNIKGDMRDFVFLPYLGNNFLMRYPDSFGQRRKVVDLGPVHNILEVEVSRSNSFWDMRCQSFYLIRAYRKKYRRELFQKVISHELLIRSIILRSFGFLSDVVFEFLSDNGIVKKNKNN